MEPVMPGVVDATVYNWTREHPRLRHPVATPVGKKRFQQRTPAIAIGLSDHIWTEAEIPRTPVYPQSKI